MSKPGEKYQPSNGTEGDRFIAKFCNGCVRNWGNATCDILMDTMVLDKDDPEYPMAWTYDAEEKPTCTKFEKKVL